MELVFYMKGKPIHWFTQVILNASTKQTEFINCYQRMTAEILSVRRAKESISGEPSEGIHK
jgi:hypothetical protein